MVTESFEKKVPEKKVPEKKEVSADIIVPEFAVAEERLALTLEENISTIRPYFLLPNTGLIWMVHTGPVGRAV